MRKLNLPIEDLPLSIQTILASDSARMSHFMSLMMNEIEYIFLHLIHPWWRDWISLQGTFSLLHGGLPMHRNHLFLKRSFNLLISNSQINLYQYISTYLTSTDLDWKHIIGSLPEGSPPMNVKTSLWPLNRSKYISRSIIKILPLI